MSVPLVLLMDVVDINPRLARNHGYNEHSEVSFVPMAAVDEVFGCIKERQTRTFGEVKKGYTSFRDGDVLFAKITPCMENGKAAIATDLVGGIGFGSTEFHVLRPKGAVLSEWIYYFVRRERFRYEAKRNFTGTAGQQRVPTSFFEGVTIPLPSLIEQRRIIDLLARAEGIVRLRHEAQMKAKAVIPALFVDIFGDPATNPKGWPMMKVAELVDRFEGGKNLQAGSEGGSEYRILKVSAVTSGTYIETESKPTPDGYEPPATHIVRAGDMLFSRANTEELVGATAIVEATNGKTLLPDKLWRFVWSRPVAPRYMHALFQLQYVRQELGKLSSGTSASMRNISQGKLYELRLPIAPLELQMAFERRMEVMQSLLMQQQAGLKRSEATFKALLNRAYSVDEPQEVRQVEAEALV